MNAILLIIMLAHGGYWFGGPDNAITVKWAAPEANMPAATLSWQLMYQNVTVASGDADVAPGDKTTTIQIKMPEARTLATYAWNYQLKSRATGKTLESGTRPLFAVPGKPLAEQAKRVQGKTIVVIDARDEGLTALLKGAGIDVTRLPSFGDLQLRQPDIILVAEDQMPENEIAQEVLRGKAQAGSQVMIFAQKTPKTLLGFQLASRPMKGDLLWEADHELFTGLPAAQLNQWAKEYADDLKAVALPADAPVLELGHWRREAPGDQPVPIDALVAVQAVGAGRIVWCQIPMAGFSKDDPRPCILLANSLDYLLTRPEPTLPQSLRKSAPVAPVKSHKVPNILTGDKP